MTDTTTLSPNASRFQLAREIRSFLDRTGMKPTPFGIMAAKDDKLLWRIECAPNGISLDKMDRIRAFMAEYRGIPLPDPETERSWSPADIRPADEDRPRSRARSSKGQASANHARNGKQKTPSRRTQSRSV